MGIQKIKVTAQEAQKYSNVVRDNVDGFFEATIFTDENGNIDAERTYTLAYRTSAMMMNAQNDRKKAKRKDKNGGYCEDCCDDCCDFIQDCSSSACEILCCCC
ncbi:MAG: hypothetical protein IKR71_06870 [Bacteroidales bacterium]|nr:hypothetical protein [Bacteroidales bacterium]